MNFPNAMIVQNGVLRGDQRQRLRGIGAKVLVLNGSKIIDPSHTDVSKLFNTILIEKVTFYKSPFRF